MTPPALSTNQLQSSPARGRLPASPRVVSPAGSQIFERDVQDSCSGLPPTSPAIPSHIQTENHIPSVLDASSEAITDDHLDPERVEIITHPSHMPAAFGFAAPTDYSAGLATWAASANSTDDYSYPPPLDREDTGSIQGSLDEVRRLSFISFADVVLAEHTGGVGTGGAPGAGNREAGYVSGATTLSGRSPSPISSPTLGSSPPTSSRGSVKGFELSSGRKPGSPLLAAASPNFSLPFHLYPVLAGAGAELNVETMSQALRRTGSADLTFARSILASPIEGPSCRP